MGCDQSKDEIKLSDFDEFEDMFNKESEKKGYNLYQKEYFYWAWTLNIEKKKFDLLEDQPETWMPFSIDLNRNIEHSYLSRKKTFSVKSLKRKIVFDLEKKRIFFYGLKPVSETQIKEKVSNEFKKEVNYFSMYKPIEQNLSEEICMIYFIYYL